MLDNYYEPNYLSLSEDERSNYISYLLTKYAEERTKESKEDSNSTEEKRRDAEILLTWIAQNKYGDDKELRDNALYGIWMQNKNFFIDNARKNGYDNLFMNIHEKEVGEQEMFLGFMKYFPKYDPTRTTASTYFKNQSMKDCASAVRQITGDTATDSKCKRQIRMAMDELKKRNLPITPKNIKNCVSDDSITLEYIASVCDIIENGPFVSLSSGDGDGSYLAPLEKTPENHMLEQERNQSIKNLFSNLSEFEFHVMMVYYEGYDERFEPVPDKKHKRNKTFTAKKCNISTDEVTQIVVRSTNILIAKTRNKDRGDEAAEYIRNSEFMKQQKDAATTQHIYTDEEAEKVSDAWDETTSDADADFNQKKAKIDPISTDNKAPKNGQLEGQMSFKDFCTTEDNPNPEEPQK